MNTPPKKVREIYEQTKIWKQFSQIAAQDEQKFVKGLVDDACSILDRIVETFPTYTLHNGQHQLNILNLYGELLGEKIKDLTDLEAAILILAAFYHDIGMVFKKSEREKLIEEEYFDEFLAQNDRVKLSMAEDGHISDSTAEWYCRWSHAKRVWKYLDPINSKLLWDGNNIRKELAEVCLSHNENPEYIKSEKIPTNFWNKSDLKFCAIMLRLADVLDFDDTRAPKSVFEFLELNSPKTSNEEISSKEWKKHFASKGFTFDNWNQNGSYDLEFKAAPIEPFIEHEINNFLDYIETEFKQCSSLLRFCSERWKEFKLPDKVNRKNIKSQGYTFGDFKFSLDQRQILSLLMGENLYDSQFVFVRELLQNAIDTSRHRKFYEINNGNIDFCPNQIDVTTWHDLGGYRWIRIDDYGMGMTFSQISKYFLKIGNSYYNSDEFKVEKLKYETKKLDFVPVSRFGIGILSCFIVGDIVEVNTRSVLSAKNEAYPLRLSLQGLHNYYVLQTDKDIPSAMPSNKGDQNSYRSEVGTSIAVRIKPNYDLPNFNLAEILDSILFNPEIQVNLFEEGARGVYLQNAESYIPNAYTHSLSSEEIEMINGYFKEPDIIKITPTISVIPINLNRTFSHPNIKGFVYIYVLEPNISGSKTDVDFDNIEFRLTYWYFSHNDFPKLQIGFKYKNKSSDEEKYINLSSLLSSLEIFNGTSKLGHNFESIVLSHNGIIIPTGSASRFNLSLNNHFYSQILGYIQLSDKLRPNLTVARSNITSISWQLWSGLNYTIRRNFLDNFEKLKRVNFFGYSKTSFENDDMNNDELLYDLQYWGSEKIFINDSISLSEIFELEDGLLFPLNRSNSPEETLRKALIEMHAVCKIVLYNNGNFGQNHLVRKISIKKREEFKKLDSYLPPLTFCEYENFSGLMPENFNNQIFNINHPFSKWLITAYAFLHQNYYNHLFILLNKQDLSLVNETIVKLRKHLPEQYKPHDTLSLTHDDFKIDWGRIPRYA